MLIATIFAILIHRFLCCKIQILLSLISYYHLKLSSLLVVSLSLALTMVENDSTTVSFPFAEASRLCDVLRNLEVAKEELPWFKSVLTGARLLN